MPEKILLTRTRTVSGGGKVPAGYSDFGRLGIGASGPAWSVTAIVGMGLGPCGFTVTSAGYDSHGLEYTAPDGQVSYLWGTVSVGGSNATAYSLTRASAATPQGRYAESVDYSFSFSYEAELVLTTYGEDDLPDDPIPADYYPHYGGVRAYEFPTCHAVLFWRAVSGSTLTGTISVGDASASVTATAAGNAPIYGGNAEVRLYHSPAGSSSILGYGDMANRPCGIVPASLHFDGADLTTSTRSATYTLGGVTVATGYVGSGQMGASVNTDDATGNVVGDAAAGVGATGSIQPPRKASVDLSATAMDQPHPHACQWWLLLKYRGTSEAVDADGYHSIIDPPVPVWTTQTGQAIAASVDQVHEAVSVVTEAKTYDARTESGEWVKARGILNGQNVTLQHYRNEQGRVMSYIVPPPGQTAADWRVGFRGPRFDALSVSHAASFPVTLGTGTTTGGDTTYPVTSPKVWEGYRYLDATTPDGATALVVGGKTYALTGPTTTVDLCWQDSGGTGGVPQYRYPLDSDRISTVEGEHWGITKAESVKAVGGTISGLTLKRGTGMRANTPYLHLIAPYNDARKEVPDDEVSSDGDTYTVEHYLLPGAEGDIDGRLSGQPGHMRWTVDNAPGRTYSTDYFPLSLSSFASQIAEVPGWSASSLIASGDLYDLAWYVCQGWIRQGAAWEKTFGTGLGTIQGQPVFDSLEWPGDVSGEDLFGTGSSGLTFAGRKTYDQQAFGPTKDQSPTIHYGTSAGSDDHTMAAVDYRIGLIGPVVDDPDAPWTIWSTSRDSGFSVPRIERKIAWYAPTGRRPGGIHKDVDRATGLMMVLRTDGQVKVTTYVRPTTQTFVGDVAAGDSAQVAWHPSGVFEVSASNSDGTTRHYRSYDLGPTWESDGMDIPGTLPARATEHATGIRYCATYDEGSTTWTCYRRYPGEDDFTVASGPDGVPHGVIATDGSKNQAGLACQVTQDGALEFSYDDGTGTKHRYSRDHGVTWTDE